VLLLIGEVKYKFVLGGEQGLFGCEIPKQVIQMNILCQAIVSRSMLLKSATPSVVNKCQQIKFFKNWKDRLLSALPLLAAFHGVEKKLSEMTFSTHQYTYMLLSAN